MSRNQERKSFSESCESFQWIAEAEGGLGDHPHRDSPDSMNPVMPPPSCFGTLNLLLRTVLDILIVLPSWLTQPPKGWGQFCACLRTRAENSYRTGLSSHLGNCWISAEMFYIMYSRKSHAYILVSLYTGEKAWWLLISVETCPQTIWHSHSTIPCNNERGRGVERRSGVKHRSWGAGGKRHCDSVFLLILPTNGEA